MKMAELPVQPLILSRSESCLILLSLAKFFFKIYFQQEPSVLFCSFLFRPMLSVHCLSVLLLFCLNCQFARKTAHFRPAFISLTWPANYSQLLLPAFPRISFGYLGSLKISMNSSQIFCSNFLINLRCWRADLMVLDD